MRYFLCACLIISGHLYGQSWRTVSLAERRGNPKNALEQAEKLYADSRTETESISSFIQVLRLIDRAYPETADSLILIRIDREIDKVKPPVKNIFQSLLADMYWHYYSENQVDVLKRKEAGNRTRYPSDWNAAQLFGRIQDLYSQALEPAKLLQATEVERFQSLMFMGKDASQYHPTLYDFLMYKALGFYSNSVIELPLSQTAFRLEARLGFVPIDSFVHIKFSPRDTLSKTYHALRLFQKWLKFRLTDGNIYALVDADLHRLRFVRNRGKGELKSTRFLHALGTWADRLVDHPILSDIRYEQALLYAERATKYRPLEGEEYRWDFRTAHSICKKAIQAYPVSRGAKSCRSLVQLIEAKNIGLQVEDVNLAMKPFRLRLSFRNVSNMYFRIIPRNASMEKAMAAIEVPDRRAAYLRGKASIKRWGMTIPNDEDFQAHSMEVEIPPLVPGKYYLIASDNERFRTRGGMMSWTPFEVSTLAIFKKQVSDSVLFYALDRETGLPLQGLALSYLDQFKRKRLEKSDTNGKISLVANQALDSAQFTRTFNGKSYFLAPGRVNKDWDFQFSLGKEKITLKDEITVYRNVEPPKTSLTTIFFTDRLLYRPGELVHFKGLLTQERVNRHKILADTSLLVQLLGTENQVIKKLKVNTNEYGTFGGAFLIPHDAEEGDYTLLTQGGGLILEVRPFSYRSFDVKMAISQPSFKMGDTVKLEGRALTFKGEGLDGAKGQYQVIRQVSFPYWKQYFWWKEAPDVAARIMKKGDLVIDNEGNFDLSFLAKPSPSVKPSLLPVYEYVVLVTVFNEKGEKQLGTNGIKVGARDLWMDMKVPREIMKGERGKIQIHGQKLNGGTMTLNGTFRVQRLQTPPRAYRKRRWKQVDLHTMSVQGFRETFPHDAYAYERDVRSWKTRETVEEKSVSFVRNTAFEIEALPAGVYRLEFETRDIFGKSLKIRRFLMVHDPGSIEPPAPELLNVFLPKTEVLPGDTAVVYVSSAEKNIWFMYERMSGKKIREQRAIQLSGEKKKLLIPVREEDKGDIHLSFFTLKNNDLHQIEKTIRVPYRDKELFLNFQISPESPLPGDSVDMEIMVRDAEGKAVKAELMVVWFDAAVDLFQSHEFELPLYPQYDRRSSWKSLGFGIRPFSFSSQNWNPYDRSPLQRYHRFAAYGFERMEDVQRLAGKQRRRISLLEPLLKLGEQSYKGDLDKRDRLSTYLPTSHLLDQRDERQEQFALRQLGVSNPDTLLPHFQWETHGKVTALTRKQLRSDAHGIAKLSFVIPAEQTQWRCMLFAHDTSLRYGIMDTLLQPGADFHIASNWPNSVFPMDKIEATTIIYPILKNKPSVDYTFIDLRGKKQHGKLNLGTHQKQILEHTLHGRGGDRRSSVSIKINDTKLRQDVFVFQKKPLVSYETKVLLSRRKNVIRGGNIEISSNPVSYVREWLRELSEPRHNGTDKLVQQTFAQVLLGRSYNSTLSSLWRRQSSDGGMVYLPGAESHEAMSKEVLKVLGRLNRLRDGSIFLSPDHIDPLLSFVREVPGTSQEEWTYLASYFSRDVQKLGLNRGSQEISVNPSEFTASAYEILQLLRRGKKIAAKKKFELWKPHNIVSLDVEELVLSIEIGKEIGQELSWLEPRIERLLSFSDLVPSEQIAVSYALAIVASSYPRYLPRMQIRSAGKKQNLTERTQAIYQINAKQGKKHVLRFSYPQKIWIRESRTANHSEIIRAKELEGPQIVKNVYLAEKLNDSYALLPLPSKLHVDDTLLFQIQIHNEKNMSDVVIEEPGFGLGDPLLQGGKKLKMGAHTYYRQLTSSGLRFYIPFLPQGDHVLNYVVRLARNGKAGIGKPSILVLGDVPRTPTIQQVLEVSKEE